MKPGDCARQFAPCQHKEKVCKNEASLRFQVSKILSDRKEILNFVWNLLRFASKPDTVLPLGENQ